MKHTLFYAASILLLLCSATFFNVANAQSRDDDDNDVDDRELNVEVDNNSVEIEGIALGSTLQGIVDRFEFSIETQDGDESNLFESELQWSREQPNIEEELEFEFRLSYIAEYRESNATVGFQANEDTIVSTYGADEDDDDTNTIPNTPAAWNNFQALPDEIPSGSTAVIKSFRASTQDGVVTIIGYISTQTATDGSLTVDPNTVKLDINVENYPFVAEDTFLVLVGRVKSESEVDDDDSNDDDDNNNNPDDDDNDQVSISSTSTTTATAGFGWANTVSVDGVATEVVAQQLTRESQQTDGIEYRVNFAFPAHGAVYLWDPTFSVKYNTNAGDGGDSDSANALSPFWKNIF